MMTGYGYLGVGYMPMILLLKLQKVSQSSTQMIQFYSPMAKILMKLRSHYKST